MGMSAVFSMIYHACMGDNRFCLVERDAYSWSDYLLANHLIITMFIFLASIKPRHLKFLPHMFSFNVTSFLFYKIDLYGNQFIPILWVCSFGFSLILYRILSIIYRKGFVGIRLLMRKLDFLDLILGIGLICIGCYCFFYLQSTYPEYYWLIHSCWHISIYGSTYFILDSMNRDSFMLYFKKGNKNLSSNP